jgi:biopolymer transport protein TolR
MIELPKRSRPDIRAEINIVPYIDVMLVLLVIFMMTTPIIEQGVEVDLPSAEANPVNYEEQQVPTVITVDADGNYYINSMTSPGSEVIDDFEPISINLAINQVIARKEIYPDMQVMVKGDRNVSYQKVIEIVALLKQYSNIDKVGFMTDPD